MRWAAAVAACGLLFFAGCAGSSSSGGSNVGSSPQAPKANPGGPYAGTAGVAVTFNGGASTDPQSQALTFLWSFGDGTTGTGINTTHTYPQVPGQSSTTYNVSLTVQNSSGLSNQASTTAVIQGVAALIDGKLTGVVMTGTKPILGAKVYLFAAGSTGYGLASVSLLNANNTGTSDATGAYVTTGSGGSFSLSGNYTCTVGQQLYIYATAGNSGSGSNSASGLLAAIGPCPSSTGPSTFAWVNEVSTVATAYALAGFAKDETHVSSSSTTLAQLGIANAFATVSNLETLSTGVALAATAAGSGVVPQAEINTLANILETCVDSSNSVPNACNLIFTNAMSAGPTGSTPTNTASAAINIAHNPAINVTSLYQIPTVPAYTPALTRTPTDFTIAISFTGGGINGPQGIAVDGAGGVWIANLGNNSVTKLSSLGAALSGVGGYTGSGLSSPNGIAIDGSGNAWIANSGNNSVTELSSLGAVLSGTGYTVGALNQPKAISIDGSGNAWIANFGSNSVTELSSSGAALSSGLGFTGGALKQPIGIAMDGAGSVWVANQSGNSVTKLSRTGAVLSGANGYTGGGLNTPFGVAVDVNGTAWVTNGNNGSVTAITNSGSSLTNAAAGGVAASEGMAIDGSGNIWIVNANANTVTELSNSGATLSGPAGYTSGTLNQPQGIAIDGSGNAWVTNSGNSTVTEFVGTASPVITPVAAGLPSTPTANGSSSLGTRP